MNKNKTLAMLTLATSGLMIASQAHASKPVEKAAAKGDAKSASCNGPNGCDGTKGFKCVGKNECKGHGDCKTAKNECKGQNACKGQGWTTAAYKEACEAGAAKHPAKKG